MLIPLSLLGARKVRLRSLVGFSLLCLLMAANGCGAGRAIPAETASNPSSPPGSGTAAGTYTIVASGSSAGLTRSVNLTLIVQ
jgi:hypothetical protein